MKRTTFIPLTLTALVLSAFAGHQVAIKPPQEDSLPAGTFTAGAKFSERLTGGWMDATMPFAKAGDLYFFGALRGSYDDNSQFVLSTGLGARYLVPGHEIIIGGNVFYDYIDSAYGNHFDQLGLGAELLTHWFDARFNYYMPDSGISPIRGFAPPPFQRFESGLEGWNTEAGFLVPGLDKWVEARLFAGYYQYHSRVGTNFEGWKARAEIRWTPAITTDIEWWEERNHEKAKSLNGGQWIAGVRVNLPFEIGNIFQGKNPFAGAGDAFKFGKKREFKERLGETVWRSHRVQTSTSNAPAPGTGKGAPSPTPQNQPVSPATPSPSPRFSPSPSMSPTYNVPANPYAVPVDGREHRIRIDVIDDSGQHTEYDNAHQGGDKVQVSVTVTGKGTIRLYDNDRLQGEAPI